MQSNVDQVDPRGPDSEEPALRGGSYYKDAQYGRSARRALDWTGYRYHNLGFRIVMELTEEEFLRYARQYRSS
jgi:formylglycine-generating enzyme required for sulfatase activity